RHTRSKRDWSSDVCSSDLKDASYRLIIQDVQVYMNFIATRDMITARNENCLQAGEFYSINRPDKQRTVMGRNPLSSSQELVRFRSEERRVGKDCRGRRWPD